MSLSKRHTARLQKMLAELDAGEARAQKLFGDRVKGSARSSRWRDAEALRAALALTAGVPAVSPAADPQRNEGGPHG